MHNTLKKTSLYQEHLNLKGKMVDFAGWLMPIQYPTGIIKEHLATRSKAGLFDVSHMCVLDIFGSKALETIQWLTVNDISKLKDGQAQYSMLLDHNGDILDDIIVSKRSEQFRIVVNSSNAQKVINWINNEIRIPKEDFNYQVRTDLSIIALQGPQSLEIFQKVTGIQITLPPFHNNDYSYQNKLISISTTGYTGEKGIEIICPHELAPTLWKNLIQAGATPAGLGARDSLRIEAGLPLYGHEIKKGTTAYDIGYGWIIKLNKGDFIGKQQLLNADKSTKLYGVKLINKGMLREGYEVTNLGKLTSGTYSPSLDKAIGFLYTDKKIDINTQVFVQIRGQEIPAIIVNIPFITKNK